MRRKYNEQQWTGRPAHATGFTSPFPPGGLITWPDGTTSRLGQRKHRHMTAGLHGQSGSLRLLEAPAEAARA